MVFDSRSWHWVPKPFGIFWVIGVSFVKWGDPGWAPGWGLVTKKTKPRFEAYNFPLTLRSPEKGEKLEMELLIIIDHDRASALIINVFLLTVFVALFYIKYSLLLEGKVLSYLKVLLVLLVLTVFCFLVLHKSFTITWGKSIVLSEGSLGSPNLFPKLNCRGGKLKFSHSSHEDKRAKKLIKKNWLQEDGGHSYLYLGEMPLLCGLFLFRAASVWG